MNKLYDKDINYNRLGYIEVNNDLRHDFWTQNKDFVPFEIVPKLHNRTTRYICYCSKFRELNENDVIPSYNIEITRIPTFNNTLKVEEIIK